MDDFSPQVKPGGRRGSKLEPVQATIDRLACGGRKRRPSSDTRPSRYSTGSSRNAATTAATDNRQAYVRKRKAELKGAKDEFLGLEWAPGEQVDFGVCDFRGAGRHARCTTWWSPSRSQRVAGAMLLGRDVGMRLRGPEGRVRVLRGVPTRLRCLTTPRASAEGSARLSAPPTRSTRFAALRVRLLLLQPQLRPRRAPWRMPSGPSIYNPVRPRSPHRQPARLQQKRIARQVPGSRRQGPLPQRRGPGGGWFRRRTAQPWPTCRRSPSASRRWSRPRPTVRRRVPRQRTPLPARADHGEEGDRRAGRIPGSLLRRRGRRSPPSTEHTRMRPPRPATHVAAGAPLQEAGRMAEQRRQGDLAEIAGQVDGFHGQGRQGTMLRMLRDVSADAQTTRRGSGAMAALGADGVPSRWRRIGCRMRRRTARVHRIRRQPRPPGCTTPSSQRRLPWTSSRWTGGQIEAGSPRWPGPCTSPSRRSRRFPGMPGASWWLHAS